MILPLIAGTAAFVTASYVVCFVIFSLGGM